MTAFPRSSRPTASKTAAFGFWPSPGRPGRSPACPTSGQAGFVRHCQLPARFLRSQPTQINSVPMALPSDFHSLAALFCASAKLGNLPSSASATGRCSAASELFGSTQLTEAGTFEFFRTFRVAAKTFLEAKAPLAPHGDDLAQEEVLQQRIGVLIVQDRLDHAAER